MASLLVDVSHTAGYSLTCLLSPQTPTQLSLLGEGPVQVDATVALIPDGLSISVDVSGKAWQEPMSDLWRGDCVQIALAAPFGTVPEEPSSMAVLGLARVADSSQLQLWRAPNPSAGDRIQAEVDINGDKQSYHCTLPLALLGADIKEAHGCRLALSFNAGLGPVHSEYYVWGGGLINGQTPWKMGQIYVAQGDRGVGMSARLDIPRPWHEPAMPLPCDIRVVRDSAIPLRLRFSSDTSSLELETELPANAGESHLRLTIPANTLTMGAQQFRVELMNSNQHSIETADLSVDARSGWQVVAEKLCNAVNWEAEGLRNTEAHRLWQVQETENAARAFVAHLRSRDTPKMGFTRDYIAQLRQQATDACREALTEEAAELLAAGFQAGPHPDGRGTLLAAKPQCLAVVVSAEQFAHFAELAVAGIDQWATAKIHTVANLVRFLQASWELDECPDSLRVVLLAFLADVLPREWAQAQKWDEVSHGCNGHNWWACEFGAIWKAGFLFPELKGFAQFKAFYPDYFEREVDLLFHDDGYSRECSMSYHIGTVDLINDVASLAHHNGLRFSDAFYERLQRAAAVEWQFMRPDGNFPAFGDCMAKGPYVAKRLTSVAANYGQPEAKYLASQWDFEDDAFGRMMIDRTHYVSVGRDLRDDYESLPARAPATLDAALPVSGHYAMRQDWTRNADFAAIEASARGTTVSSHGHSAIFDLHLASRGRTILAGNGKGPDVADMTNQPRRWRISNRSHSTATVDDEDHVELRRIYRFQSSVTPTVECFYSEPSYAYFSGSHEAYVRLPKAVAACRRKLFYCRGDYWILLDRFSPAGEKDEHHYRQHFQVAVPVTTTEDGRAVTSGAGGNLLFAPVPGLSGDSELEDCPWPTYEGAAQQLSFAKIAEGNSLFATVLVPFVDDAVPDVEVAVVPVNADGRELSAWEATGLEVTINGRRDVYVDFHTHWHLPWDCGGHRGNKRLYHSHVAELKGEDTANERPNDLSN